MLNMLLMYKSITGKKIRNLNKEKVTVKDDFERGLITGQIVSLKDKLEMIADLNRVEEVKRHVG